jgi:hypothetical protein
MRLLYAGVLAGVAAVLATSCSAARSTPAPAASQGPSASSAPSTTASHSPGQRGFTVPRPAAPSATGRLRVLVHDAFPVASTPFLGVVGAEAPDGSVFATFGKQQAGLPAVPAGTAVYVVDGDQPAQVAEHPAIPVTALAADDTSLYVGGGDTIIAYARSTGAIARTWNVTAPVRLMALGAGRLWAVLGSGTGSGQVVEINPGASTVTAVGTDAASVTSVAAGPLGLYYVEAGGATIVRVSPNGTRLEAATHQRVNEQLSGPGAIQAISVIGDRLFLVHDAGQGMDSSAQTYDASTLTGPLTSTSGTTDSNHAIGSLAGPLDVSRAGAPACSGGSCVGRYDLGSGALTDAVRYPQGTQLGLLLGPYPAVFVVPPSGHVYLDRIG